MKFRKMRFTTILAFIFFNSCVLHAATIGVGLEHKFSQINQVSPWTEKPKILFRRLKGYARSFIFIARANSLVQFDPQNLSILNERNTGPRNFSIFCFGSGVSCASCSQYLTKPSPEGYSPENCGPRPTDAFVKTWATSNSPYQEPSIHDYVNPGKKANNEFASAEDALYVCYNILHGYCERLQLSNISIALPWKRNVSVMDFYSDRPPTSQIPVVNWNASLYASLVVDGSYLYVGIEQDAFQEATLVNLDPLSVRMRDFDYARKQPSRESSLKFRSADVRIQYKFSFQYTLEQSVISASTPTSLQSPTQIYFVIQQPKNTQSRLWSTRIARICSGDLGLYTYVELEIACSECVVNTLAPIQKTFDALHLASRGTIGGILARSRFAQLKASTAVPHWRQPIPMSGDFTNVLVVAFAPQLMEHQQFDLLHYPDSNYYGREGSPESHSTALRGTAIVLYTMAEVDVQFSIVIRNCLVGKTRVGPPHFTRHEPMKCVHDAALLTLLRDNNYCPSEPMNWPICGSLDSERLQNPPSLILDADVTGVATTMVADEFTVLVLTTDRGSLHKYIVEEGGKARLLTSKCLTSHRRPLWGLTLDDAGLVAFAVSDEKLYRVELQNCSSLRSCKACLAEQDPYCGWCVVAGRCTHKGDCSSLLRGHWLSYLEDSQKCPMLTHVTPSGAEGYPDTTPLVNIHLESMVQNAHRPTVTLSLPPLLTAAFAANPAGNGGRGGPAKPLRYAPAKQRRLSCAFRLPDGDMDSAANPGDLRWATPGMLYARTSASPVEEWGKIRCLAPLPAKLPQLAQHETSKKTLIWLEAEVGRVHYPLASGLFTIYNCKRLTTCQNCTTSEFDCVWCLTEGRCTSVADLQRHKTACGAVASPPGQPDCSIIRRGSHCGCPSFSTNTITTSVPKDETATVLARVSNMHMPVNHFLCSERCTRRRTPGLYNSSASTVACTFDGLKINVSRVYLETWHSDPLNFFENGRIKCGIEISWHSDYLQDQPKHGHPLTNSNASILEVYDCGMMAAFCDSCLALPKRFGCVWYQSPSSPGASANTPPGSCIHDDGRSFQVTSKERGSMYKSSASCPHPRILQISPENATLTGQTKITIRGVNLGDQWNNLSIRVTCADEDIGNVPCDIDPTGFQPSRQVVCQLHEVLRDNPFPGAIKCLLELRLNVGQNETSIHPFAYLTPKIISFGPIRGPFAGGTLLKIHGENLNVGGSRTVILLLKRDHISILCPIISITAKLLICRTPSVSQLLKGSLELGANDYADSEMPSRIGLAHDKTSVESPAQPFLFTPNPTIRTVEPSSVFFGGGITLRVYGLFLDSIETPLLVFYHKHTEFVAPCRPEQMHIVCTSPSLRLPGRRRRHLSHEAGTPLVRPITNPILLSKLTFEEPDDADSGVQSGHLQVSYGFIMDNVTDLLVYDTITVLSDPQVFPFSDHLRVEPFTSPIVNPPEAVTRMSSENEENSQSSSLSQNQQLLRFDGDFKGLVEMPALRGELTIFIGDERAGGTCAITAVKADEIRCEMDKKGLVEGQNYPVLIKFGQVLLARPGSLQFKKVGFLGQGHLALVLAPSLAVALILIGSFLLAMWCRSRGMERAFERRFAVRWAEQEKCVARLFKNDFMELQMHMEEVVQDLNKNSLPIRDYETYCLFFLFPDYHLGLVTPANPHDTTASASTCFETSYHMGGEEYTGTHPLISTFQVPIGILETANRGIFLFNQLLLNRHFLFLLVRAIEANREIDARARSHFASLLSVVLQPKMEYQTYVILLLISDLLRKSRSHGGDSRLLTAFRRAESVVAKMLSNWFTFLMYNYIKDDAGEQIFILYRALLQQINTGPRDAVTGYARYTLDASTLLKTHFPSKPITLCILDPEGLFTHTLPQGQFVVRLLSCDTITQAKEKILDALYRTAPYFRQIRPTDIVLEKLVGGLHNGLQKQCGRQRGLPMSDWDLKIRRDSPRPVEGPPFRLNCLSDYKLVDNDPVLLVRALPQHAAAAGPPPQPITPSAMTLQHPPQAPPTMNSTLVSGDAMPPWNPSSLPGSLFRGSAHATPSTAAAPARFQINPTGAPDPRLWYHLEKPTIPLNVSQHQRQCPNETSGFYTVENEDPLSYYSLLHGQPPAPRGCGSCCCLPHPKDSAHDQLTGSRPPQSLDAAALRRWLATATTHGGAVATTAENHRVPTNGRRQKRRRQQWFKATKRSLRTTFTPSSAVAASETVQLAEENEGVNFENSKTPIAHLPCEMFLNRLLCTRGSVANYMNQVVEMIFNSDGNLSNPPICIKFLFDFLDRQAEAFEIHDPNIIHAWKSNCLHLRFWNQVLVNQDYIFDIPLLRNTALERSFRSFSQAITYACSPVLDKITKDSPINKALFATDIERHWHLVKRYFAEVKAMPAVSPRNMDIWLRGHSQQHQNDLNISWAVHELYSKYVTRCFDVLVRDLSASVKYNSPSPIPHDLAASKIPSCGSSVAADCEADWIPEGLLRQLHEVNQCMIAVARHGDAPATVPVASIPTPASPRAPSAQFPYSTNTYGSIPPTERELPPLPSDDDTVLI